MTRGGEPFDVEVISPGGDVTPAHIKHNNDGTYDVDIEAEEAGPYKVDLFLRNKEIPGHIEHIKDFPKTIIVEPGVDPKQTLVHGPGLEDGILDTQPTYFMIETRDAHGRVIPGVKGAGQPFEVAIQGPNGKVPARITDNNDGTYRVDYEPTAAGTHTVGVTLKGEHVAQSPYKVRVDAGAFAGTTLIREYKFVVESRTRTNQVKQVGGEAENFSVVIDGPGNPKAVLEDAGNGEYVVSFALPNKGKYAVNCKLNGNHIVGSPFNLAN